MTLAKFRSRTAGMPALGTYHVDAYDEDHTSGIDRGRRAATGHDGASGAVG